MFEVYSDAVFEKTIKRNKNKIKTDTPASRKVSSYSFQI